MTRATLDLSFDERLRRVHLSSVAHCPLSQIRGELSAKLGPVSILSDLVIQQNYLASRSHEGVYTTDCCTAIPHVSANQSLVYAGLKRAVGFRTVLTNGYKIEFYNIEMQIFVFYKLRRKNKEIKDSF